MAHMSSRAKHRAAALVCTGVLLAALGAAHSASAADSAARPPSDASPSILTTPTAAAKPERSQDKPSPAGRVIARVPETYRVEVRKALEAAGANAGRIASALEQAKGDEIEGMAFLVANMPERDLTTLSGEYLLENVRWAYEARKRVPWGRDVPKALFLNDVLPYASLDERRDDWRKDFYERFLPLVQDCKTPAEAAQALNAKIFRTLRVRYRSNPVYRPAQSPYQTIERGLASCTGLSVVLANACRAVCVPARLVVVPEWSTRPGYHTWTELWDGEWYFVGAAEPSRLNHGWFVGEAAQANPQNPLNRIYASSFGKTDYPILLIWDREARDISAVDRTEFYRSIGKRPK